MNWKSWQECIHRKSHLYMTHAKYFVFELFKVACHYPTIKFIAFVQPLHSIHYHTQGQ